MSARPLELLDHGLRWPWTIVAIVLLGTGASQHEANRPWDTGLAVLLAVVAALPAVLVVHPAVALLVSGAATGGYFLHGFAQGPVFLALPTVMVVVAGRHTPRAWLPAASGGLGLALVGLVARSLSVDSGSEAELWQIIGLAALTAAAAAVGTAYRSREDATHDRAQRAASEERLRMAQDLHDGVGHGLAVIAMQAGVGLHLWDRDPVRARASLEAIRATSTEALGALRAELSRMSGESAARRPAPGLVDVEALVDRVRAAGLSVEVVGSPGIVGEPTGRVVYAVVQEALTNVLRHARAERTTVCFDRIDETAVVAISNHGAAPAAVAKGTGMGITGMRARVEALGGSLEVGPTPDGFRVHAEIPA